MLITKWTIGKNTWRITSNAQRYPRKAPLGPVRPYYETIWARYGHLIRTIELDYSFQETRKTIYSELDVMRDVHNNSFLTTPEQRMQNLHNNAVEHLEWCWKRKNTTLGYMTNLESVTIDLSHLFCPFGCCRKEVVEELLGSYLLFGQHGFNGDDRFLAMGASKIVVEGAQSDERELVEEWRRRRLEGVASVHQIDIAFA